MLRIRIGQRWKQDRAPEALDAFGVELDGVALVPGASEEPLGVVMEHLLAATAALAAGQTVVQVSLPESNQELLLVRHGDALRLRVLRLGRPAGAVRPPVTLDLEGWRRAVVRTAREWVDDLRLTSAPARVRQRARTVLTRADREAGAVAPPAPGWGLRIEPGPGTGFRLEATDPDGLLAVERRPAPAPLAPLAVPGRLSLVAGGVTRWEVAGPVGLLALELLRHGEDLVRALEAGERVLHLALLGVPPPWEVDLVRGQVGAPGWTLAWSGEDLVRALIAPALALASVLSALDPGLAQNPHLLDFITRARAVLAALRALVVRPAVDERGARRRSPRPQSALVAGAGLRRLGFLRRGVAPALAGEGSAELHALGSGFALLGRTEAVVVSPEGTVRRRWTAQRGIALGPSGEALLAGDARWLGVRLEEADARWLRDHDGVPVGTSLLVTDDQFLVTTPGEGIRALCRLTGRERWRFRPQRPQRLDLLLHAGRVLVASELGSLHGLDVVEGAVRFRLSTPLPCLGPPVPWGRAVVAPLGRADRSAFLAADAHSGTVRWVCELGMACVAAPLARRARVRILGARDGTPVLVSLGPRGATKWERSLPLGPGPWTLHGDGDASLVTSSDGSAVRVDARGRLEWRLGGQSGRGAPGAALQRGVLLVPGETVRAVDIGSGRLVAEIPVPGGLHAIAATEALDIALLDAAGDLTLWKLGASLGLVESRSG